MKSSDQSSETTTQANLNNKSVRRERRDLPPHQNEVTPNRKFNSVTEANAAKASRRQTAQNQTVQESPVNSQKQNAKSVETTKADNKGPLTLEALFGQGSSVEAEDEDIETLEDLFDKARIGKDRRNDLKITIDGKQISLNDLVTGHSKVATHEQRELQFEQRRIKSEGDLMRAQSELREILQMIPREHVTPDLVKAVQTRQSKMQDAERNLLMNVVPEWENEAVELRERQGMVEHLKDWGFPDAFLSTIHDHRALKYMRDNWIRDRRIKEALARVETETRETARPTRTSANGKGAKVENPDPSTRRTPPANERDRIMDVINAAPTSKRGGGSSSNRRFKLS